MAMNKVPTLVVGIGGIGCRMAANVADLLTEEDRKYVGVVGLDTNVNDLKQLKKRGMRTIQTSDSRTVRDYMTEHFFSTSWFPLDRFTAGKSLLNGAGQIRAVSRLAALAAEEQGKFLPIKEEIQRIRQDDGQLTVMVVGSLTGGTGAGLFLQLPYYLRKVMHEASGRSDIVIRGMFVGPDMTADVQPSKINRDAVYVNGYACLKELNALYLRENGMPGIAPLELDFYDPATKEEIEEKKRQILEERKRIALANGEDWEEIVQDAEVLAAGNPLLPYDYVYLIENSNAEGTIGSASLPTVEELVGRIVYTLMFSPAREKALSVEDNMVLRDMATKGMNRYSSAGICRLVYPMEIAREYVTLATVRDMVREEWLALDERYKAEVAAAREAQRTDISAVIPSCGDSYYTNFESLVTSGESSLGRLGQEAFYKDAMGNRHVVADKFFTWMEDEIKKVTESETVTAAKNACRIDSQQMESVDSANSVVFTARKALADFETAAKAAAGSDTAIANKLFPSSWSILSESKKDPERSKNIYNLLYNVHPITARFFCYYLIKELEKKIAESEESFRAVDLNAFAVNEETHDYDNSQKDRQNITAALSNFSKTEGIPLVGGYIAGPKLKRLASTFIGHVEMQVENVSNYLEHSLWIKTCTLLKSRIEMLSENYRVFFDSIAEKVRFNDMRIAHLESMNLPLGQIGVYCTKEAFESMAAEFQTNHNGDMQMSTKTAVFEKLYTAFETEYANRGKVLTERQKEALVKKKLASLGDVFDTAVVDTIRTSVVENGAGIVDIDIRTALEKEYELLVPDGVDDALAYTRQRIEEAMIKAAPMLSVDTNAMAENTQTVYMAINPACAETRIGADQKSNEPNEAATQETLIPESGRATDNLTPTVLMDESFSAYEITCMKARYKFAIEDLVKYKEGSVAQKCYEARIRQLGQSPLDTGNPDDGLTVVPPHLHRHWHEEAYLPAIYPSRQERNKRELGYAFIYALGTDFFVRIKDDQLREPGTGEPMLGWFYPVADGLEKPLKLRGTPVGTSFEELYRALPYLGQFKRLIMKRKASDSLKAGKRYPSVEEREAHLLENDFIADLVKKATDKDVAEKSAEGNIFSILLEMRGSMQNEWNSLFDALLWVLQDYCKDLYNYDTAGSGVTHLINRSVRTVLDAIAANSEIAGKAEDSFLQDDFAGKALYKQYIRIREAEFKG